MFTNQEYDSLKKRKSHFPAMNSSSKEMPELRSGLYYMDGLAWLAVISVVLSIFVSLSIIFSLKFSKTKWSSSYHYRLRFSLAILLLLACINQLIHFILHMEKLAISEYANVVASTSSVPIPTSVQELTLSAGFKSNVSYLLIFTIGYPVLFLLMMLTLDRYKRIHSIRPGMPLHIVLTLFSAVLAIAFIYVIVLYYLLYYPKNWDKQFFSRHPSLLKVLITRDYVEPVVFISGLVAHYYFNIALLVSCIKSVEDRGYWWRYIFTLNRVETSCATARRACSKQQRRLALIIKMIRYFLALFLSDVIVFTAIIIATKGSGPGNDRFYVLMSIFGESWVPVHVFCLFKLLDSFVNDLQDHKPKPDRPAKFKMWPFRLLPGRNNKAVDSAQRYHIKTDTTELDASEIENISESLTGTSRSAFFLSSNCARLESTYMQAV